MAPKQRLRHKDKSLATEKHPVKYCPIHNAVRLRTIYTRGIHSKGQHFLTFGAICPVPDCNHVEMQKDVLLSAP